MGENVIAQEFRLAQAKQVGQIVQINQQAKQANKSIKRPSLSHRGRNAHTPLRVSNLTQILRFGNVYLNLIVNLLD